MDVYDMRGELRKELLGNGKSTMSSHPKLNAENMRWLMSKSGSSIKEMERATGIKDKTLRMYQSGFSTPSLDATIKIADYFCVPVDFILGRCSQHENGEIFDSFEEYFRALRKASFDAYLIDKYELKIKDVKGKLSIYPYNLIEAIFQSEENEYFEFDEGGLETAIQHLSEQEQRVVRMRFRDEMTLAEIANAEQLSEERVRQIVWKACRKLRHPSNIRLIRYGNLGVERKNELDKYARELASREKELDRRAMKIEKREEAIGLPSIGAWAEAVGVDVNEIPIEEVGFTTRAYNGLKRADINTMNELAVKAESGELFDVKNIGAISVEQILQKLELYGLGNFWDKYPSIERDAM